MGRALRLTPAPVVAAALAALLLVLLAAATASAEPGFEYGEAVRFGGFDGSAYDHGRFDGSLTPGKFVDPTGFTVDPQDNTVYVVDRTSSPKANPTDWRIQQLSPEGAVLGTTMFTLPNEPSKGPGGSSNASAIEGLAVDHHAGRLYALVAGSAPPSSPYEDQAFAVAQEVLAWSTKSVAGGLVAAIAAGGGQLRLDPLANEVPGSPGTVGGVVSSEKQLLSGATPLYGPQGIAVDPLEAGVDDPVAIEASDLVPGAGHGKPVPGNTIVQQVATQGAGTGDLLAHWSGASVDGILGASWGPHGISTDPGGMLTVLLDAESTTATNVYTVALKADFSRAAVLESDANVPSGNDLDQSPTFINDSPFFSFAGATISDLKGTAPQVIHLSPVAPGRANSPYAAVIFSNEPTDVQVSPTGPPGSQYWTSGENPAEEFEANIGVRLLEPEREGGAISNLHGRTIVNTLGNRVRGGPCNIGAPAAGLAAGADGTLWILDRGPKADEREARGQGREVIELAPGSERPCPQPSGTFTTVPPVTKNEFGEEELRIPAGTQVTFNAKPIHREGGKPFAYEWDLDGDSTNGSAGDGFEKVYEMQPIHYYFPPSSIAYTYTRPGEYKVRFRMHTDYGVYTPPHPVTVIVTKAPFHPEPRFTATAAGQQVTFNASGSTPGVGKIVNYHWSWGDGGEEDEDPQIPVITHTYTEPRSYQVTLTVTNSAYQSVTSAPQTVTVVAPPPPKAGAVSLATPLYDIPAPFALYPIPSAPEDRTPTRLSPRARFAAGAVSVTLACPATKQLCAGTASIETAAAFAVAAKTGKGRHRTRRMLLARATFAIPGGRTRTLKMRLSAKGMALLRSSKHLKVLVIVAAHDSLGDPATTALGLTLSAPAVHGRGSSTGKKHGKR
jgi:PKD repeat protein